MEKKDIGKEFLIQPKGISIDFSWYRYYLQLPLDRGQIPFNRADHYRKELDLTEE